MDVILDANSYIQVLHNHGRSFLQTNQFSELLTYLRRTGSRLVIPELTYREVVARYRDRLTAVTKTARDSWSILQGVDMAKRIDFIEPDIEGALGALGELLSHPSQGVQTVIYRDYSRVDIREVAERGIVRKRPANEKGEELRDVILWLVVLQYAAQSKKPIAFISGDKAFQGDGGGLHPDLRKDLEQEKVTVTLYPLIRDFVKGNALKVEPIEQAFIAAWVDAKELRGISTEQLLGSNFWGRTTLGAEVSHCEFAEGRKYLVGEDSYYVEARYTGEGIISLTPPPITVFTSNYVPRANYLSPHVGTAVAKPYFGDINSLLAAPAPLSPYIQLGASGEAVYESLVGVPVVPELTGKSYKCSFSIRLSLRIVKESREALEVDEFVFIGELAPIVAGSS